ncbi:MAG: UDP-N-acetylmuramoyl-L-alanyl-D-glutamate--2,6-diaminopimelate ligase [Pseudomonadota bacterium]
MTIPSRDLIQALQQVWPGLQLTEVLSDLPDHVRLVTDSRKVESGDVFVAVPGSQQDGRDFTKAALKAGAALVLSHTRTGEATFEGAVLTLPHLALRLGELGRTLFDVPEGLDVIAVTGTNGKSSVTHYIAELSERLGTPAGVIGTLGSGRSGTLAENGLTTPGPLELQATLGCLAAQGIKRVALEASSHALDQNRLDAVDVKVGVFTNLSRDHLDYHGSMAAYAAAKAKLFRRAELSLAVVNGDDPLARLMLSGCTEKVRVLASGQDEAVTLRVLEWHPHADGQQAVIATPDEEKVLDLSLMGRFNLDNVLLAMATLYGLDEKIDDLVAAARALKPVPGRMELYHQAGSPGVVIDYAHTPDALHNALKALKAHSGNKARLWCVFGCGGDRDAGKRAEMAKEAEKYADVVVVTDDNPREEAPEVIRAMIMAGFSDASIADAKVVEIAGRRQAIAYAVAQAATDDVILVAGKGHEAYQEINGIRHPYLDSDEVNQALTRRNDACN